MQCSHTLSRKVTQVGTNLSLKNENVMLLLCCVSGALVFQLKRRPPDYQGRKGRKVEDKAMRKDSSSSLPPEKLPYLVELSPGENDNWCSTPTLVEPHRREMGLPASVSESECLLLAFPPQMEAAALHRRYQGYLKWVRLRGPSQNTETCKHTLFYEHFGIMVPLSSPNSSALSSPSLCVS